MIDGLQFVVDHKDDYNIRVVNLSLRSTQAESYLTDPLDAAVEAAWNAGIVVVVAAGNEGTSPDAVNYAPANDPYVITVGGVDDMGTDNTSDDALASWSSRGTTQDGVKKPDILAPGAHMVSTIPAGSDYTAALPDLRGRRAVLPGRRYLDVGGGRLRRRRRPCCRPTPTGRRTRSRLSSSTAPSPSTARERTTDAGQRARDQDQHQQPEPHRRRRRAHARQGDRVQPPAQQRQRRPDAEHADRPGHRPDRLHPRELEPRELVDCDRRAACLMEPRFVEQGLLEPRYLERDAGKLRRVRACLLEPSELVSCVLEPRLAGAARAGARTACRRRSSPPRTTARSTPRSLPLRRSARSCSARSIRLARAGLVPAGAGRAGRPASTSKAPQRRRASARFASPHRAAATASSAASG